MKKARNENDDTLSLVSVKVLALIEELKKDVAEEEEKYRVQNFQATENFQTKTKVFV
jgi:rRNA maturation endonuclease Nob1